MNRREFLKTSAMAGSALAAGCSSLVGKTSFYGPTIRDRLWMWGHHPAKGETTFKGAFRERWGGKAIDQAAGCRLMGIPNDCVIRWGGMPRHPWGDYFEQFRQLKRFSFGITDGARGGLLEKMRIAFEELKPNFPNFTGCFLDDYFCKHDIGQKQLPIEQVAERVHAHGLRLSIVHYSDQNGIKPEFLPTLKCCDEISFWFWRSANISTMPDQVCRFRDFIGPEKDMLLGLYMWDYTLHAPVAGARMEEQLEYALRFLHDGTVSGLIFHPSYLASLEVPSVRLSKDWIAAHGEDLWNA